jgi:hypothetical protein
MAAQRRIDLILESVRRLLRMGATPNLLNLLQKQHPADLAQISRNCPSANATRRSARWWSGTASWPWRR